MYNRRYDELGTRRAKELRKEMTEQERKLWYCYLRTYPLKFYRQRPVDIYILDFYCSKAKLALELDGSQHFEELGSAGDRARTEALNRLGIDVLRFSNADIDRNFRAVCEQIDREVKRRVNG